MAIFSTNQATQPHRKHERALVRADGFDNMGFEWFKALTLFVL